MSSVLKNIFEYYCLPVQFDKLSKMDGFGMRSVAKLQNAIENSKMTDLQHFIAALSIPISVHHSQKNLQKYLKLGMISRQQVLEIMIFHS